jgi:hypothetical protein
MSDKSVSQKLLLKPGHVFLLVNPPPGYMDRIGAIPDGVTVVHQTKGSADVVQAFVTSQKQLEQVVPSLKPHLKPGGLLWVTYPKGTSALASDLNRDTIWKYAKTVGMDAVAMFAVDETWSAMRLKLIV